VLTKSICKRCREIYLGKDGSLRDEPWDEFDDEYWDKKQGIACPFYLRGRMPIAVNITEQPPEFCPFHVEHLMAEQDAQ
jgi:hypothetical protein